MSVKPLTFNGFDLQTSTIVMTNLQWQSVGKNLNIDRVAGTNVNKFIQSYVSDKVITYTGYVKGTSASDAETKMDNIKQNVGQGTVAPLVTTVAGENRTYDCIVESFDITDTTPTLDIIFFTLSFVTIEPLGKTAEQTQTFTGVTTSPTYTVTFDGTFPTLPMYKITINSAVDLISISVFVTETNKRATFTAPFNAGDVFILDTGKVNPRVLKNGQPLNVFLGFIPKVARGTNDITFDFTSTSHDVDIEISYNPKYL